MSTFLRPLIAAERGMQVSVCRRRCFLTVTTAEDWARIGRATTQRCDHLVEQVLSDSARPAPVAVLHGLDELSRVLCAALDSMELARNVHPDVDFAAAADASYQSVAERLHKINMDQRLHKAVIAIIDSPHVAASLNFEQARFARAMAEEFESDGVHLDGASRLRVQSLQGECEHAAAAFARGTSGRGARAGVWISAASLQLPTGVLGALAAQGDRVLLPTDRATISLALDSSSCRATRETLSTARAQLASGNLWALEQMLYKRGELATELGHRSYAHYAANHGRMEGCPDELGGAIQALCMRLCAERDSNPSRRAQQYCATAHQIQAG